MDERGAAPQFRPDAERFGFFRSGIAVPGNVRACAECGFIALELYVRDLHDHLAFMAKPEIKAWLEEKPDKPL